MMSGQIPAWGYVVMVLLANGALLIGMWIGWGRGWKHCEEEQRWAREQAKARRVHPVYPVREERTRIPIDYRPAPIPGVGTPIWSSPEVAHEAWLAHTEQAMQLANPMYQESDGSIVPAAIPADPRSDTQWTRDMAEDMSRFLAGLLDAHPATEEL